MEARVTAVSSNGTYSFSKPNGAVSSCSPVSAWRATSTPARRSARFRMEYEPDLPNLRQVHLMHEELFDELAGKGFAVAAGDLGENITTRGIDLLGLPTGALLRIGAEAVVEVTGLRNPCAQINTFRKGLLREVFEIDPTNGDFTFKAGIMGVVRQGGGIHPGDPVEVSVPAGPHRPLERV